MIPAWMYTPRFVCRENWAEIPFTHEHRFVDIGFCYICGKTWLEYWEELYSRFNFLVYAELKNRRDHALPEECKSPSGQADQANSEVNKGIWIQPANSIGQK